MLSGASSGNTGHLATNFYYTRDRAVLEAEMTARARRVNPGWLAGQPNVPCNKTGMIYLARTKDDEKHLAEMLKHAELNNVPGVRMISLSEVQSREPSLNMSGVTAALLSEDEYIVDSWLLSMTHVYGMEVAGVKVVTRCQVTAVDRDQVDTEVWTVTTSRGQYKSRIIINCAGLFGDDVEKLFKNVRGVLMIKNIDFTICRMSISR